MIDKKIYSAIINAFLFAMVLMKSSLSYASDSDVLPLAKSISVHSDILGEKREIIVHTPNGYGAGDKRYPVLYLLDGDFHIRHVSGLTEFLANQNLMPEVIVVAIPNTQGNRTRDLTPKLTKPNKEFPTAGGADNFIAFLEKELMPTIENKYRTEPYKILVGHSFGGIFALHAQIHYPKLFNAYINISPSMWWDEKAILSQANKVLAKDKPFKSFVYMTMGNEGGKMLGGAWEMAALLEEQAPDNFEWHFEHMPDETHGSVHHISTYNGLKMLFKDWQIKEPAKVAKELGVAGFNEHFKKLTKTFGFHILPDEGMINAFGYYLLQENNAKEALAFFKQNVENFPSSANAYDSLADGLKALGQLEEAKINYQKACRMGKEQNHFSVESFCRNAEEAADS